MAALSEEDVARVRALREKALAMVTEWERYKGFPDDVYSTDELAEFAANHAADAAALSRLLVAARVDEEPTP